jgi:hypothetical protein
LAANYQPPDSFELAVVSVLKWQLGLLSFPSCRDQHDTQKNKTIF